MFLRFVVAAVRFRRRRLLLAFSALAVAATLATALFSIYSDIDRKMRVEFRGYGANLIIAPAGDARTIPLAGVAAGRSSRRHGRAVPLQRRRPGRRTCRGRRSRFPPRRSLDILLARASAELRRMPGRGFRRRALRAHGGSEGGDGIGALHHPRHRQHRRTGRRADHRAVRGRCRQPHPGSRQWRAPRRNPRRPGKGSAASRRPPAACRG